MLDYKSGEIPADHNIKRWTIIPPDGGWEGSSYYVVDVAFSSNNPIHRSILYTGFLREGGCLGGGYCGFLSSCNDHTEFYRAYFIKAVRKINFSE